MFAFITLWEGNRRIISLFDKFFTAFIDDELLKLQLESLDYHASVRRTQPQLTSAQVIQFDIRTFHLEQLQLNNCIVRSKWKGNDEKKGLRKLQ